MSDGIAKIREEGQLTSKFSASERIGMLSNAMGENVGMHVRDAAALVTSANKHGNTRTKIPASGERAGRNF